MILDNDTISFQRYQRIENDLKNILNQLEAKHKEVLGKDIKIDYKAYLVAPSDYLVSTYWQNYCSELPSHLNKKSIIFSQTNIDVNEAELLGIIWNENSLTMRADCLPKITLKGVKWGVRKELFNRYLDDSKKDHYNALQSFLEAYENLNKYENLQGLRYLPRITRNYTAHNLELGINPELFVNNN